MMLKKSAPDRRTRRTVILVVAIAAGIASLCSPLTVHATTVGDVIAHAYAVGLPESDILACINQFGGGTYTSEQCDKAIAALDAWAAARDRQIEWELEIEASHTTTNDEEQTTSQETETVAAEDTQASNDVSEEDDGVLSESDFIDMTLDEKKDYMQTLSDEERADFLANMTNDEKNNMLKQMSTSSQLEVISQLIDVGDAFGLSYSVDSVSDDAIILSARDADGNLVSVSTYGETVEKTGYAYTIPIVLGVSAIALGAGGLVAAAVVSSRKRLAKRS